MSVIAIQLYRRIRKSTEKTWDCDDTAVNSFLKANRNSQMAFIPFCDEIMNIRQFHNAAIVACEAWMSHVLLIEHRFLILELRTRGGTPVWLRLDRRGPMMPRLALASASFNGPAHDTVKYRIFNFVRVRY